MSRKKVFLILIVVLAATVWVSFRIISERKEQSLQEGMDMAEQDLPPIEQIEPDIEGEDVISEVGIEYFGHSCFMLDLFEIQFLLDPYSPQVGYGELQLDANVITVSHEHMDHNYVAAAPGAQVIRGLTADGLGWEDVMVSLGRVRVTGLPTYHDDASGRLRGRNMAFIFEFGEIKIAHLGDLGHLLNESQAEKLRDVDILMVPIGGHYTIDAKQARELVLELSPAVVLPMHYRTEATRNWPIDPLKTFIEGEKNVKELGPGMVRINLEDLPEEGEIWVLKPTAVSE